MVTLSGITRSPFKGKPMKAYSSMIIKSEGSVRDVNGHPLKA